MDVITESSTISSESPQTTSNFEDKRRMLFASLDTAEQQCLKGTNLEKIANTNEHGKRMITIDSGKELASIEYKMIKSRKLHGKQSIFKRPELPISKCLKSRRPNPDYSINPHKWQKYSLNEADISDRTNTAAASFLDELDKRKNVEKQQNADKDADGDAKQKVKFNRNKKGKIASNVQYSPLTRLKYNDNDVDESIGMSTMKGTKVLASEYVVGQQKPKLKAKKIKHDSKETKPSSSKIALKLDHLLGEDECDDD